MAAIAAVLAFLLPATPGAAFPVATDGPPPFNYELCGRVFPDPNAYWPSPEQAPNQSPWAKGNANCRAVDFLGYEETLRGLDFLASEGMFSDFVEVYNLGPDDGLDNTVEGEFAEVLADAGVDGMTAGLPEADLQRDKAPLYMVRVTDEEDTNTAIEDRQHFAFALSLHGIERAGVEGGIRAVEDLATWASCEKYGDAGSPANCAQENAAIGIDDPDAPHPILETMPEESTTAGTALKEQSVWFLMLNPDGWRRGDKQRAFETQNFPGTEPGFSYQRYNGNGMDINRDWPTKGYTFRPYTPWSEPETRAVGAALKAVKSKWTAGVDLHGQLTARAFSFTLIGGSERPFDKDRRVLQFTKGAWADAEQRLSWSPLIVPTDEERPTEAHMYGVQWGTIWDTIDYTVTGDLGGWMDSPMGLDADGIDNEMTLSHLGNCGTGTCYDPTQVEQLHVDGNKSLIYAQMHYSRVPEDTTFNYSGKAGYLHNPNRVTGAGTAPPAEPGGSDLPPQDGFDETLTHNPLVSENTTYEFDVLGPEDGVYNGGLSVEFTSSNLAAVSPNSSLEFSIDQYRPEEENPEPAGGDEDWQVVNSYFNQSNLYLQAGAQVDANQLTPGKYRIRISGPGAGDVRAVGTFTEEETWPDPGQIAYDVSNMDFFTMLREFVPSDDKLTPVQVDDVLAGNANLQALDTLVITDQAFLQGYREPVTPIPTLDPISGTAVVAATGAGERNEATSAFVEFDVGRAQEQLDVTVESITVADPDLYLQRRTADGGWSGDLAAGETGRTGLETLTFPRPSPGRYRLEIHGWAGSGPADYTIDFTGREKVVNPTDYTAADRDRLAQILREFVRGGGNLVLTDDALRALQWMEITPDGSVSEQVVYAGNVQFSTDEGETDTYDDPLAANVDQPGAAEGEGNRHQVAEPVPTGFAIQDESGGDMNSHPQWGVNREAFEEADGRIVGMVSDKVTLGEIKDGKGRIRILGSLLPMPTEEYDHPYGLMSYGVTYSGYEVFRNLLDWDRDTGSGGTDPDPDDDGDDGDDGVGDLDDDRTDDDDRPVLPATGGGIVLGALGALGTGLLMRRRMRSKG